MSDEGVMLLDDGISCIVDEGINCAVDKMAKSNCPAFDWHSLISMDEQLFLHSVKELDEKTMRKLLLSAYSHNQQATASSGGSIGKDQQIINKTEYANLVDLSENALKRLLQSKCPEHEVAVEKPYNEGKPFNKHDAVMNLLQQQSSNTATFGTLNGAGGTGGMKLAKPTPKNYTPLARYGYTRHNLTLSTHKPMHLSTGTSASTPVVTQPGQHNTKTTTRFAEYQRLYRLSEEELKVELESYQTGVIQDGDGMDKHAICMHIVGLMFPSHDAPSASPAVVLTRGIRGAKVTVLPNSHATSLTRYSSPPSNPPYYKQVKDAAELALVNTGHAVTKSNPEVAVAGDTKVDPSHTDSEHSILLLHSLATQAAYASPTAGATVNTKSKVPSPTAHKSPRPNAHVAKQNNSEDISDIESFKIQNMNGFLVGTSANVNANAVKGLRGSPPNILTTPRTHLGSPGGSGPLSTGTPAGSGGKVVTRFISPSDAAAGVTVSGGPASTTTTSPRVITHHTLTASTERSPWVPKARNTLNGSGQKLVHSHKVHTGHGNKFTPHPEAYGTHTRYPIRHRSPTLMSNSRVMKKKFIHENNHHNAHYELYEAQEHHPVPHSPTHPPTTIRSTADGAVPSSTGLRDIMADRREARRGESSGPFSNRSRSASPRQGTRQFNMDQQRSKEELFAMARSAKLNPAAFGFSQQATALALSRSPSHILQSLWEKKKSPTNHKNGLTGSGGSKGVTAEPKGITGTGRTEDVANDYHNYRNDLDVQLSAPPTAGHNQYPAQTPQDQYDTEFQFTNQEHTSLHVSPTAKEPLYSEELSDLMRLGSDTAFPSHHNGQEDVDIAGGGQKDVFYKLDEDQSESGDLFPATVSSISTHNSINHPHSAAQVEVAAVAMPSTGGREEVSGSAERPILRASPVRRMTRLFGSLTHWAGASGTASTSPHSAEDPSSPSQVSHTPASSRSRRRSVQEINDIEKLYSQHTSQVSFKPNGTSKIEMSL